MTEVFELVSVSLLPAIKRSSEDANFMMNLLLRISGEENGIPDYVFKALLTLSKKYLRLQPSHLPTSAQYSQQLVEILCRYSKLDLWAEVESFVTVFSSEVSTANAITLQSLHIPFLRFLARALETHDSSLN
jgi:hypothetical protein